MKQILSILVLTLCACSSNNNINLTGRWIEVLTQGVSYVQGMDLKEDGSVRVGRHEDFALSSVECIG